MVAEEKPKLSEEEFVRRAVKKLRGNYKGIHSVYTGFNTAFKEYFGTNPVETTQRLVSEGKIVTRPVNTGLFLEGRAIWLFFNNNRFFWDDV